MTKYLPPGTNPGYSCRIRQSADEVDDKREDTNDEQLGIHVSPSEAKTVRKFSCQCDENWAKPESPSSARYDPRGRRDWLPAQILL